MSGFVASPPPPSSDAPDAVAADGWWPAISLKDLRDSMRIGEVVTQARLRDAVLAAMASAMDDLARWKAAQVAESVISLAGVWAPTIGGQSKLVHAWRRAIYSYAAADLAETHRPVAATIDGRQRTEAEASTADELRRNGLHAVREILGRSRSRIALL